MLTLKLLRRSLWLATGLAITTLTLPATALPLPHGATVALSGTTAAAEPDLNGTVVQDVIRPFAIKNAAGHIVAMGTFQDRIVKSKKTGRLDFYFRLINNAKSTASIFYVDRVGYGKVKDVDVDYRTDGLGTVGAASAARSAAPQGNNGGDIVFNFSKDTIAPGEQSRFHFIGTQAEKYNDNSFAGISTFTGGNFVARIKAFQPE